MRMSDLIPCTPQQLATLHGYNADMRHPSNPQPIGELHWAELAKRESNGDVRAHGTFPMLIDKDGLARTRNGYVSYGLHELENHTGPTDGPACLLWGRGGYATTRPDLAAKALQAAKFLLSQSSGPTTRSLTDTFNSKL